MTSTFATATTIDLVREDDTQAHIEDERIYGAIRNGILLSSLTWNDLTEEERTAARYNMFYSC